MLGAADLIRKWDILGARIRLTRGARITPALISLRRASQIGQEYAISRMRYLRSIMDASNLRFAPIGDPLCINLGLNRWLLASREEAYSDWLAWILQELRSARAVIFLLFGDLSEELNNLLPYGSSYTVDREVWVSEGHAGRAGRLDCVVSFAPHAVVVLELKTSTDAERSDTAKHEGYFNELARRQEAVKKAILIASSEIEVSDYSGFDLVTWAAFCTRARTLLIQLLQDENRLLLACLLAAFVSAVEQNILGYPTLDALRQNFYLSQLQFTRLASYLRVSEGD